MVQPTRDTDELDYQLGVNDIDLSNSIASEEDVLEFEYEAAAVFKRLADDIYETAEAGIREPLTNAITTTRRAKENFGVEDAVISITVIEQNGSIKLRLRDNGEGITKSVLENVLTVIGRSTARDDGELSGQFGMGFLASYKLVGLDGGFIMYTNPRGTDEGPYGGLFKPGRFEPDKNNELPNYLSDDEYGTLFEYFVRDDLTVGQIREWVENHSKFSPIPIMYREVDEYGNEYTEDYHADSLLDLYGDSPSFYVDTPYFEAASSPRASSEAILITSPVRWSGKRQVRRKLPWRVDVRLKYENGIVAQGPNEGLIPLKDSAYEALSEDRKKYYIPKTELVEKDEYNDDEGEYDLCLPESTGTRERLKRNSDFAQHVAEKLYEQYISQVHKTLDKFNPDEMSLESIPEMDRRVLKKVIGTFVPDENDDEYFYTESSIKSKLNKKYNYDGACDELVSFMMTMSQRVKIISDKKDRKNKYPRQIVHKLDQKPGDVYMCVSKSSWKAEAVELSEKKTHIVKLDSADEYELFEDNLNWKPLKTIKKSNVEELLGLSEEELNEITTYSSTKTPENVRDRIVKVHVSSGGRSTKDYRVSKLIDKFNRSKGPIWKLGDVLLLFPQNGEYKVSENYDLADKKCSVASCSKKEANLMTDECDRIIRFEDYESWVKSKTIMTSNGTKNLNEIISSELESILFITSNSVYDNRLTLYELSEIVRSNKDNYSPNPIIATIDSTLWAHIKNIRNSIDENSFTYFIGPSSNVNKCYRFNQADNISKTDLVKLFTPEEMHNSEIIKTVSNNSSRIDSETLSYMKLISECYKKDIEFNLEDNEIPVWYPTVKTTYGEERFNKVYNRFLPQNVIIHFVKPKHLKLFESDDILERAADILFDSSDITKDINRRSYSSKLYIPISTDNYNAIKDHIEQDTICIGQVSNYDRVNNIRVSTKKAYCEIMLPNWDIMNHSVFKFLENKKTENLIPIIKGFKHLHDNNVSLESFEINEDNIEEQAMELLI